MYTHLLLVGVAPYISDASEPDGSSASFIREMERNSVPLASFNLVSDFCSITNISTQFNIVVFVI